MSKILNIKEEENGVNKIFLINGLHHWKPPDETNISLKSNE